jgi:hypothetical protein
MCTGQNSSKHTLCGLHDCHEETHADVKMMHLLIWSGLNHFQGDAIQDKTPRST